MTSASYDFSGSTALVTGAAGDIGGAVARRLAGSGARVALTDLPVASDRLEVARKRCAEVGGEGSVVAITADVTDEASVTACLAAATDQLGTPDLVFNNAGYQGVFVATADYPGDDFSRVLSVNVQGVFNVLRESARRMRAEGCPGAIVNTASMAGVHGAPNMIAYSAAKAAVISLTQSASKDLAPLKIRVNAISPAFIGPGTMWDRQVEALQASAGSQYFSTEPVEVARQMIAMIPMRRCGTVDEVATTVLWLLSDGASYITGQNIAITGRV